MTDSAGRSWRRIVALALAGVLAAAGLWLAVGAGAKGGESARDAAYPVTYSYVTKIDNVKFGKLASTHSKRITFKFHVKGKNGADPKFVHTVCKLDGSNYKRCDSPKRYKHLHKGKHRFRVKALYDKCSTCQDASAPDSYRWKVK